VWTKVLSHYRDDPKGTLYHPVRPSLTSLFEERPETPPSPLSTVPFRHDPDFVDHGTLIDQINVKTSKSASRIALVGLGGVG
jgi:hypothetical protein